MNTPVKLLAISAALAACSVDPVTFKELPSKIGGSVTGLDGQGLVLTNNGGDELAIAGNGPFEFAIPMDRGASYAVAVKVQPSNPSQICTVTADIGTAVGDVTDVQVSCSTIGFRVGGTVTGLVGSGLVLQDNAGDDLSISGDGHFAFATLVTSGANYVVTVRIQPSNPAQVCSVARGTGTIGSSEITDVAVTCSTSAFAIGGTVTGLVGSGLVLQNNAGDDLSISGNGNFRFATPVASGGTFQVTVRTHPTQPSQTCTVGNATGTVGNANVTNVAVSCTTNAFTIGGTISGLATGNSITLRNNGGDDLVRSANGGFTFSTPIASGQGYNVTVVANPTSPVAQTCTVANASGTVGNANVTSVAVSCTTRTFTIGGSLSGLAAGNSITLRNNGGNDLVLSANGSFTFSIPIASGQGYSVTIVANPTSPVPQTCQVSSGTGTVGSANVNVGVSCSNVTFSVRGTFSGLTADGLVLLVTGTNSGPFDFPIPANSAAFGIGDYANGATYSITVKTQPSGLTCTVLNGTGTINNADVNNVQVICTLSWSAALFPIAIPGTANGIGDLTFDNNGDLLVAANTSRSIVRVNHATGALTMVATLASVNGIAISRLDGIVYSAANNTIYVTGLIGNGPNSLLIAVAPDGTATALTMFPFVEAIAIAPPSFGAFGGFIIGATMGGSVIAVDPAHSNSILTITSSAGLGSDLAFAPDGTLYICGGGTVRTLTAAGAVTTFATGFGSADGIAISADGTRMFIADSGTDTIRQIVLPGGVPTQFAVADIDDGFAVGGLVVAPGNVVIAATGETSLTLRAFGF